MKRIASKVLFAVLALMTASVLIGLVSVSPEVSAQIFGPDKVQPEWGKVIPTRPNTTKSLGCAPSVSSIVIGASGEVGRHKLVETPHGMIQLDTGTAECTLISRDEKGAVARTEIAVPARLKRTTSVEDRMLYERGLQMIDGPARIGTFELVHGKAGTFLHDTRDARLWSLGKTADGKLAWESTNPDEPKAGTAYLGINSDVAEGGGLSITQVYEGSAAAAVGLRVGDVIERADDKELKTEAELKDLIRAKKVGDSLKLKIRRGEGKYATTFTLEVTLGEYR